MAWTEADRVKIRNALGFGAIFLQAYPMLENAITSVQAISDGGTRPDNSTELFARQLLTELDEVFAQMRALRNKTHAAQVDELKVDVLRGLAGLRREGRSIVKRLAIVFATDPKSDVFGVGDYNTGVPFDIAGKGY